MTRFGPDFPSDEFYPNVLVTSYGELGISNRAFPVDDPERVARYVEGMRAHGFRVVVDGVEQ